MFEEMPPGFDDWKTRAPEVLEISHYCSHCGEVLHNWEFRLLHEACQLEKEEKMQKRHKENELIEAVESEILRSLPEIEEAGPTLESDSIGVLRHSPDALFPKEQSDGSFLLYSVRGLSIPAHASREASCGLSLRLPEDYFALVFPVGNTPLIMLPKIVPDSEEIIIKLYNPNPNPHYFALATPLGRLVIQQKQTVTLNWIEHA